MDAGAIGGGFAANYSLNPAAAGPDPSSKADAVPPDGKTREAKAAGECETCKNRRYQDGSNDPGVSFKSPTKLSPGQAATAVASHEREHYNRETGKAESEGREVVSSSIRIFTSICPECGRPYVSGGETTTVTKGKTEQEEFAERFFNENVGVYLPKQLDVKA